MAVQSTPQCHFVSPHSTYNMVVMCIKDTGHRDCHEALDGSNWTTDITKSDEEPDLVSNVRELIRSHAIFTKEYFDATQDLLQSLENIIQDQETEVRRLTEEQIKPLADFLMQQSGLILDIGDEDACAMAIRVIGELIGKD